ncbi:hypothetical protein RFI_32629 [Reticulomyxa filosa]|uniref:Uncharacterized protein n=1 Tax=Reticulomyxa filosa TaxID=46433 RepID=X6LTR5_RETFI|nr:hypothetical protein RFI_32629 [Reticulomyxa filosa]|eukprot:ETO04766.1 hypothetical protein RFI_32629 [Reticulomyxa filosa]
MYGVLGEFIAVSALGTGMSIYSIPHGLHFMKMLSIENGKNICNLKWIDDSCIVYTFFDKKENIRCYDCELKKVIWESHWMISQDNYFDCYFEYSTSSACHDARAHVPRVIIALGGQNKQVYINYIDEYDKPNTGQTLSFPRCIDAISFSSNGMYLSVALERGKILIYRNQMESRSNSDLVTSSSNESSWQTNFCYQLLYDTCTTDSSDHLFDMSWLNDNQTCIYTGNNCDVHFYGIHLGQLKKYDEILHVLTQHAQEWASAPFKGTTLNHFVCTVILDYINIEIENIVVRTQFSGNSTISSLRGLKSANDTRLPKGMFIAGSGDCTVGLFVPAFQL